MPSVVIRQTIERAEKLLRRVVAFNIEAFWKIDSYEERVVQIDPGQQIALPAGMRVTVSCAADLDLKIGWMQSSTQVVINLDQLVVIPSALTGAFIRNDSTDVSAIVRVVSF